MRTLLFAFILASLPGHSQTLDSSKSDLLYVNTRDGWTTFQKDTVLTGVVVRICGGIGKRSDVFNGRIADVLTFRKISNHDSLYIVASQKQQDFAVGDTLTIKVGPWKSNFSINNCKRHKDMLLTSYIK